MRSVHTFILISLLCLPLAGCPKPTPVPNPPPDTDKCPAACEKLRSLGCEEGQPLEDGTTCEQFCQATQDAGHWLNPTCIMSIESCGEIEDCGDTTK